MPPADPDDDGFPAGPWQETAFICWAIVFFSVSGALMLKQTSSLALHIAAWLLAHH